MDEAEGRQLLDFLTNASFDEGDLNEDDEDMAEEDLREDERLQPGDVEDEDDDEDDHEEVEEGNGAGAGGNRRSKKRKKTTKKRTIGTKLFETVTDGRIVGADAADAWEKGVVSNNVINCMNGGFR